MTQTVGTDPTPSPSGTSGQADWTGAVTQVRAASSWVVKAFAAIALALVGTSPLLVNLGNLDFNARGIVAAAGALIALAALGLIISWATDVNLTEITDVVDLTTDRPDPATRELLDRISDSPRGREIYLGGKASVSGHLDFRARTTKTYEKQLGLLARMPTEARSYDGARSDRWHVGDSRSCRRTDPKPAGLGHLPQDPRPLRRPPRPNHACCWGSRPWNRPLACWAWDRYLGQVGLLLLTHPNLGCDGAGKHRNPQLGDDTECCRSAPSTRVDPASCASATVVQEGGSGDPINPWQVSILPNQTCSSPAGLGSFSVDRRFATFTGLPSGPKASLKIDTRGSRFGDAGWLIIVIACCALIGAAGYRGGVWQGRQGT